MTLPDITGMIPNIVLPFNIPTMFHPLMEHILIAVPVIVLLIELVNLVMKKKAVSGVSFFLILLMGAVATHSYIVGQENVESSKHLLETYLMVGAVAVLLFKLIAMLTQKTLVKLFYILVLAFFVFLILQYDKMNVEARNAQSASLITAVEKNEVIDAKVTPAKEVEPTQEVASKVEEAKVRDIVVPTTQEAIEVKPVEVPRVDVLIEEQPTSVMESTGIEKDTVSNVVQSVKEEVVEVITPTPVPENVQVITENNTITQ